MDGYPTEGRRLRAELRGASNPEIDWCLLGNKGRERLYLTLGEKVWSQPRENCQWAQEALLRPFEGLKLVTIFVKRERTLRRKVKVGWMVTGQAQVLPLATLCEGRGQFYI